MKFCAHGEYSFRVGKNYLLATTRGGFNEEGVHRLFDSAVDTAAEHGLTHWVYIEVIDKEAFITPGAVDVLFEKYSVLKAAGCHLVMTVCGNWMQKEVFHRLQQHVPLPVESFEDEAAAIKKAEQY